MRGCLAGQGNGLCGGLGLGEGDGLDEWLGEGEGTGPGVGLGKGLCDGAGGGGDRAVGCMMGWVPPTSGKEWH